MIQSGIYWASNRIIELSHDTFIILKAHNAVKHLYQGVYRKVFWQTERMKQRFAPGSAVGATGKAIFK